MPHSSPPAPNFFALVPYDSPNVIGFLYWLCSWAEPGHRRTSEALHTAGVEMLQSLLGDIGGSQVDSFSRVELFKQRGPEMTELCFLRVNGTHALLLSTMSCPDDGSEGKSLGYWDGECLALVAICCEELPVFWQRVETDCSTLVAWEPDPGMRYLSLEQLYSHPVFRRPSGHDSCPWIAEFGRALMATVQAEQRFREIPPERWDLQAWHGFYKLLAGKFGGRLSVKPMGALKHPFCRISWQKEHMDLCLEDARLSVILNGPLSPSEKLFRLRVIMEDDRALSLAFERSLQGEELPITNYLMDELPEETHPSVKVSLLGNIFIINDAGLVDVRATTDRLISARDFLTQDPHDSRTFAAHG